MEFRVEIPSQNMTRINTYSHDKKNFTAKFLVAFTPIGFISFKSRVFSGNTNDMQIILESGIINFLYDWDIIVVNGDVNEIQKTFHSRNKNVVVVPRPSLDSSSPCFIPLLSIYIEKLTERIRTYKILDNTPEYLYNYIP